MFCPNCGKQIKDNDNFCRYCGTDLKFEESTSYIESTQKENSNEPEIAEPKFKYDGEELVLYEVKKHIMSLFWAIFLTPIFLIYFWTIFLNTHSLLSWVIVIGFLIFIILPILHYNSDRLIVTTNFVHIRIAGLKSEKIEIPIENIDTLEVTKTALGDSFNYGLLSFSYNGERYDYGYVKDPEDLQYIIENPEKFVKESVE